MYDILLCSFLKNVLATLFNMIKVLKNCTFEPYKAKNKSATKVS